MLRSRTLTWTQSSGNSTSKVSVHVIPLSGVVGENSCLSVISETNLSGLNPEPHSLPQILLFGLQDVDAFLRIRRNPDPESL